MSRLTDDRIADAIKEGTFIEIDMRDLKRIKKPSMEELYEKSNRYERIEEEIGCPLEVVFKALKNGVYYKENRLLKSIVLGITLLNDGNYYFDCSYDLKPFKLLIKDYQKTWWLKEDRSE